MSKPDHEDIVELVGAFLDVLSATGFAVHVRARKDPEDGTLRYKVNFPFEGDVEMGPYRKALEGFNDKWSKFRNTVQDGK